MPGIFAAVPYCIDLIGGPYIETDETIVKAFRPKSARSQPDRDPPHDQTRSRPIERKTGAPGELADAAIIWMHGLGADANDFVPLVPELDLRAVGDRSSASCSRTRRCMPVTINGGMSMRAWYDILHMDSAASVGARARTSAACARRRRWSRR